MKTKKYIELRKLKGLMREKNISYKDMANLLDINYTTFSDKINGYTVFNLVEIFKIIDILKIPKEEIYYYFF